MIGAVAGDIISPASRPTAQRSSYLVSASRDVTDLSAIAPPQRRTPAVTRTMALAAAVIATSCVGSGIGVPDAGTVSGEIPESFDEIQASIFGPACAAPCHKGGSAPKGLSLEDGRALPALVGVPSSEVPELLRVAPGRPTESYLLAKLVPRDARRVGGRMPRNGPPYLSDAQVRALSRWIRAGATADWHDGDEAIDAGGRDAEAVDAGAWDAPAVDAGARDAPAIDARPGDAAPADAIQGTDASAVDAPPTNADGG